MRVCVSNAAGGAQTTDPNSRSPVRRAIRQVSEWRDSLCDVRIYLACLHVEAVCNLPQPLPKRRQDFKYQRSAKLSIESPSLKPDKHVLHGFGVVGRTCALLYLTPNPRTHEPRSFFAGGALQM
jgi:hypothetical protein